MVFPPPQALLGLQNTWRAPYQIFNQTLVFGPGIQDNNHSDFQSVASTPVWEFYFGGAIGATTASMKIGPLSGASAYIEGDNGLGGILFNGNAGGAGTFQFTGTASFSQNIYAAGVASSADPTGVAGRTGIGTTTGVGNGASANLTALAQGTGGGPASTAAVGWVRVLIGTTAAWVPYFV